MNWGHKLILVFIAFAGFMGYMVYSCMQAQISLVSKDYYKDELNYQKVIDGNSHANKLSKPVELVKQANSIQLQIPTQPDKRIEGNVWFYCVSDAKKDRKYILNTDENGAQQFLLDDFKSGRYIAKIQWETTAGNYYTEKEIIVP